MIDLAAALVFAVIGLIVYGKTSQLPESEYEELGAGSVPQFTALLLLFLALLLFISGMKKYKKRERVPLSLKDFFEKYKNVITLLGFLLVSIFLMRLLGFMISLCLFLFCSQWVLSPKTRGSLWVSLAVSGAIGGGVTVFFQSYMNTRFPLGSLIEWIIY